MGEDLTRPRLARGDRIPRARPGCMRDLDALGFSVVGYGCTTCIGNSGPLPPTPLSKAIDAGRARRRRGAFRQPQLRGPRPSEVRANYLASPPLVVAYALGGVAWTSTSSANRIGTDGEGRPVYPARNLAQSETRGGRGGAARPCIPQMFRSSLRRRLRRRRALAAIEVHGGRAPIAGILPRTYVAHPPYFEGMQHELPARSPTSGAPAAWPCSAIRSPPTTSRRRARSSKDSPAGQYG